MFRLWWDWATLSTAVMLASVSSIHSHALPIGSYGFTGNSPGMYVHHNIIHKTKTFVALQELTWHVYACILWLTYRLAS